jgi:hypothetical protein
LRRRRGVLLVLVLILIATMFVLAGGFLSMKTRERQAVMLSRDSFQAQQLAMSGLETVRVRLQNDYNFPPATMGPAQEVFKFSETVMSYDGSLVLGNYQIFCDRRWVDPPYEVLRVTSIGQVGDKDGNPVRHKIIGEFSLVTGQKGDLINLTDLGSF